MQSLLSAHQPVYLPWLGFFHKIIVSDLFVIFDDVSYSKKMWYNRNYISGPNNKILLTVPVKFNISDKTKHKDILIDNSNNWQKKHWKSIYLSYSSYPFFSKYEKELEEIYSKKWIKLVDLNLSLIFKILDWMNVRTKIVRASDYKLKKNKSELIIEMCQKLNFNHYLFGELGKNYCDVNKFKNNHIKPYFQKYNHPRYKTWKNRKFFENICILDLVFNCGDASINIIKQNNFTKKDYFDTEIIQ